MVSKPGAARAVNVDGMDTNLAQIPQLTSRRRRLRALVAAGALLATGTVIGATTQHLAGATGTSSATETLRSIEPCRLIDTRPPPDNIGGRTSPLGAKQTLSIDTQQSGTPCSGAIPTDATSLALNVTGLNATSRTYLTLWAGGERPLSSSLNPAPGQPPLPNAVTVGLDETGKFAVYNHAGSVDIVIDVVGYYASHHHDDRYAPRQEMDARIAELIDARIGNGDQHTIADLQRDLDDVRDRLDNFSADDLAPGSLTLSDLANVRGQFTTVENYRIEAQECERISTGRTTWPAAMQGRLVLGNILTLNGLPYPTFDLVVMPTVLHKASPTGLHESYIAVCNTGDTFALLPNNAVIDWMIFQL